MILDLTKQTNYIVAVEEPDVELDFPRVYEQPLPPAIECDSDDMEALVKKVQKFQASNDKEKFGQAYNQLVKKFQPLITWAISCWHYLLTTEGCRFLLRSPSQKNFFRGDYRAFIEADFQKFVYSAFKKIALKYNRGLRHERFSTYVQEGFWNRILKGYRRLQIPQDRRQRQLTGYSYLRCSPYLFLNSYHQNRVDSIVGMLPKTEQRLIELYFLRFFTENAIAKVKRITISAFRRRKKKAMMHILKKDRLVYVLLLQIERY